jgi:phospholipase C
VVEHQAAASQQPGERCGVDVELLRADVLVHADAGDLVIRSVVDLSVVGDPDLAAATPPQPDGPAGQMDFTFDRLGIRLPAIAISPWIPEKTVVNATYRNTSVIRTMRERWNLGPPLTARDADAADIAAVLTLDQPRAPEDWPDVSARPVPTMDQALLPLDQPLSPLAQALVAGCLALARQLGHTVPTLKDPAALTGAQGLELIHQTLSHLWPALKPPTTT